MPEKPEDKVYMVTARGNAELNAAGTALSALELRFLVQVDGIATVAEIWQRTTKAQDLTKAIEMLEKLAKQGFIADPDSTAAISVGDLFKESEGGLASLQANGYYVRIARRGPPRPRDEKPRKFVVLAVEDDPQLAKLVKMFFGMDDFVVRLAATREEINKALREPPKPDIVLLDVTLPDTDGFDVLEKMRAHPTLKDVPIIMATAKATREAVLNGLRKGCDGYITKPYDMAILIRAVRSVLGLKSS